MRLGCSLVLLSAGLPAMIVAAERADEKLPFDFLHNQIVLRVTVKGGGPYNFVLDTGTHASTIDLGLAIRLGLPLSRTKRESRGAGSSRVYGQQTVLEELRVGALTVRSLPAAAMDLTGLSRQLGRPLHGVLGNDFLAPRITQIDYFRRQIRFLDESPVPQPDDSRHTSFPMQFLAGDVLPLLEECYINGTRTSVTLDTGSSLGLILFPETVRRLGLEDLARSGIPMDAAGYRGTARLTKGWVRSMALKTIDLGAIEVAYVQSGYGDGEEPQRRGGNLGNAVLQDFVVTLDYRNRMVVLVSAIE
jgi:hypothetical protein